MILHTSWLSPFARNVQLLLEEQQKSYTCRYYKVWENSDDLFRLNHAHTVPVLELDNSTVIADSLAIVMYLQPESNTEIWRLYNWFNHKFYFEVTQNLLAEKVFKRLHGNGNPESQVLRTGSQNLKDHLSYIDWLISRRKWLAGEEMSIADLAAAAHLSCIDYLDMINWAEFHEAKSWYMRLKSRKSFQPLLQEQMPGLKPAPHYTNLDF